MKTAKYENIYTALYNQSVQHDNQLGKVDQKWAYAIANRNGIKKIKETN